MTVLASLPSIADTSSRVLILGSMPGGESLRRGQYYAHSQNHFWRLMYAILDPTRQPEPDYGERIKFILRNKIALWDVLRSCEREGSADASIRNGEANDFQGFYAEHPGIRLVLLNVGKAYESYRRLVGFGGEREYRRMPSTSPANAVRFEEKLRAWKIIREYI